MTSEDARVMAWPDVDVFLREHDLDHGLRDPLVRFLEQRSRGLAGPRPGTVSLSSDGAGDARLVWTRHVALGGMGEIHRVYDQTLNRLLIMKVLRDRYVDEPTMHAVFMKEAQVTAQLAHPSIPPVHEIGELDDGRPFFTMKEVHGQTLSDIVRHTHRLESQRESSAAVRAVERPESSRPATPRSSEAREEAEATAPTEVGAQQRETDGERRSRPEIIPIADWTEHRLLEVFQKVCEAVAYAHTRGVIHCDLKPENVMVGRFGEVVVMDWGVALLAVSDAMNDAPEPPVATRGFEPRAAELVGGTPGYMAPEQMAAAIDQVGPHTDVFALGVMLFELLAGERPYRGKRTQLLQLTIRGEVPPLPAKDETLVDDALQEIIWRAMRPGIGDRFADASEMAAAVSRWREGALKRDKARRFVRRAERMIPEIEARRRRVVSLRAEAERGYEALTDDSDADQKAAIWKVEDEAEKLEQEATVKTVEAARLLRDALVHAPGLGEAKELLATLHYEEHRQAEERRDWAEAARHEILLRAHDQGEYEDYLAGNARLVVAFEKPCRIRLYRYRNRDRRLVGEIIRAFATTDSLDLELPVGSYLLELRTDDAIVVRYPCLLRRRESWEPADHFRYTGPVALPAAEGFADDDIFVPAGPFRFGGDPQAPGAAPLQWEWADDFVIKRDPVDGLQMAQFLASDAGAPWRHGVFRDSVDIWRRGWPAVGVSYEAALAFADWASKRDGLPWRLPDELEWEKAARGTDGRFFPWGDHGDSTFCHARAGARLPQTPTTFDEFESDSSPYGLRGMAGNVRDWCTDEVRRDAVPKRIVRGGSWQHPLDNARAAARGSLPAGQGYPDVGFRLVRSL